MLNRGLCVIIALLISLFAFSVRADEITITNNSELTAEFRVITEESDKTIFLSPGEKQRLLGRSLRHDEIVMIYGVHPSTGASCALSIHQQGVAQAEFFYLPHVTTITGYPPCAYDDNLPLPHCNCFEPDPYENYCEDCLYVKNAIVNIYVKPLFQDTDSAYCKDTDSAYRKDTDSACHKDTDSAYRKNTDSACHKDTDSAYRKDTDSAYRKDTCPGY